MKNRNTLLIGITLTLSGIVMSFGGIRSPLDELAMESGPVMDSITKPQYPGESPAAKASRLQLEQATEEAKNSFKIVMMNECTWKMDDGSSIAVHPGNVLVANGSEEGKFIVPYHGVTLLVPFSAARRTPFTAEELAARQRELQRLFDSSAQVEELREQNRILNQIQAELERLD